MSDDDTVSRSAYKQPRDIPRIDIDLEKYAQFHVRAIERDVDDSTEREPPHRHNFQEVIWIQSGSGKQAIDNQILRISHRTFYLIAQGQVHKFIKGHDLAGLVIQFTNNFLLDLPVDQIWIARTLLFNNLSDEHTISVPKTEIDGFELLLDQMVHEYNRNNEFGRFQILRHLLNILLIRIQRVKHRRSDRGTEAYTSEQAVFRAFIELLEEKYRAMHNVFEYAEKLIVSPRHLSSVIKHFSGRTAKEMISERLALEAKRYLMYSDLSVKEIAFALGFSDPSHFSKTFKQVTKISPTQFKLRVNENA